MTIPAGELEGHAPPTAPTGEGDGEPTKLIAGKSPMQLAMMRFRKDRLSMIAFYFVAGYLLIAISAPFLVKFGVLEPNKFNNKGGELNVDLGGIPNGRFGGISWDHLLGIEPQTGRDVLSRLLLGTTFSLSIALAATILAVTLGTVLGIISGFSGGIVDAIIGRITDLTLSFPQTLMLLALSGMAVALLVDIGVPAGDTAQAVYVVVVLGLFGWPGIARIIRGQVLTIREREFIEAAKLFGASRRRIYFKEILPNLWAPLLVYFTLMMPAFISAEAALAFLQVSVKPPTPTLGNILTTSIEYSTADFTFFFVPAFLIAAIVISFNLLGDGLRDALDPRGSR